MDKPKRKYRDRLKGRSHVVWVLQAKPGRSGKQEQGANLKGVLDRMNNSIKLRDVYVMIYVIT